MNFLMLNQNTSYTSTKVILVIKISPLTLLAPGSIKILKQYKKTTKKKKNYKKNEVLKN